jgi:hypothetical protein
MTHRRVAHVAGGFGMAGVLFLALGCGGSTPGASTTADDFVAPMPAEPPPVPPRRGRSRAAAGTELRVIDELVAIAQRVRGLALKHAVPVMVEDAEAIAGYVETELDADELDRARAVYVALGLIAPDLDVKALLVRLMEEQIVGYYDTTQHRLVVRDDVMRSLRHAAREGDGSESAEDASLIEARVVLVHEIVHALQDQHLGLGKAVEIERDTDADNAFRALIEGDAYLAMLASSHASESHPLSALTRQPEFRDMLASAFHDVPFAGEQELARAPAIVRVPLLSAYLDGLVYAAALHAEGGWSRLDRAHAAPPVSTEQVLHPQRTGAIAVPVQVALPGLDAILARAQYALLDEDTFGELELAVYFAQNTLEDRNLAAADGWGGDRLYAYRGADPLAAIVWATAWDDAREAEEAETVASRIHGALAPERHARSAVVREGRSLLIVRHLPPELHADVRTLFAHQAKRFASAGTGDTSR